MQKNKKLVNKTFKYHQYSNHHCQCPASLLRQQTITGKYIRELQDEILFRTYSLHSSGTDCRRTFSNWRIRCLLYYTTTTHEVQVYMYTISLL